VTYTVSDWYKFPRLILPE